MVSSLHKRRLEYRSPLPAIFRNVHRIGFSKGEATRAAKDHDEIKKRFPSTYGQPLVTAEDGPVRTTQPMRVGVVFSGGQAAGGHNVIAGLLDFLIALHPESVLFGFLGGPSGIIEGRTLDITEEVIAEYRNQGGFDLIGSGRTKIETEEQLQASLNSMNALNLDGLVVIGGDDSNTNAAVMAEYFITHGCKTKVIGVPKTIDGDLKNEHIAISFGFDTAAKVYSEMIGNIARDALSARKYYHFIKLMGRSASHIALECALATHPNYTFLSEEVAEKKMTLSAVTNELADLIVRRAREGKNYGVILIPEGLIEFIPEIKVLIQELNSFEVMTDIEKVRKQLTPESRTCFDGMPPIIQQQLLMDRDPHGNVQVSHIETEALLIATVKKELQERKERGEYQEKFNPLKHFFGYEGRAAFPSNFDSNYCYALGATSAILLDEGLTGYMACVKDLMREPTDWKVGGVPITMLMNMETRKGKLKPVIEKALVNLKAPPYKRFASKRGEWMVDDDYRYPGPSQYFGDSEVTDSIPFSLHLELER